MELLQPVKAGLFPRAVRRPLRAMLHRAARGDAVAYQILMERYFDLILESLVLSDLAPPEALARTKTLLREGWQRLPYLKRLSDWERFLALSLLSIEPASDSTSCEIRQNLFKLKPEARFALIVFEFENWELPWLALALRIQPRELNQLLLETRCQLLNIDLDQTSKETRRSFNIFFANLN